MSQYGISTTIDGMGAAIDEVGVVVVAPSDEVARAELASELQARPPAWGPALLLPGIVLAAVVAVIAFTVLGSGG
ncbi:hypothetical protein AB0L40_06610 [Patulibacter sp. NPDC049589]|uniref:hypothetical protein n=1 Tax=Patulibacter sp. NPDC049589 TaxID=3154731 RepID=UPI0034197EB1